MSLQDAGAEDHMWATQEELVAHFDQELGQVRRQLVHALILRGRCRPGGTCEPLMRAWLALANSLVQKMSQASGLRAPARGAGLPCTTCWFAPDAMRGLRGW